MTELSEGNGHTPRKVLQCSLCNTVIAVLSNGHEQTTVEFPERYELALNRLETNVRNIHSGLAHLRSQISALTGQVHKRL